MLVPGYNGVVVALISLPIGGIVRSNYPRFLEIQLAICDVSFSWKNSFSNDTRVARTDSSKIGQYAQDRGSCGRAANSGYDKAT